MKNFANRLCLFTFLFTALYASGQDTIMENKTKKWFAGYELLEMSMNNFSYFAGEAGYRISPKHQVRLVIGEIRLTERHLSSAEAFAVDGNNVKGYFRIYEASYDRFFGKSRNWYYSGSIGYVNDRYEHMVFGNTINNHTPTLGTGIGYNRQDLFGIRHLYVNISMPFRYYFHAIPEQQWGDTKILEHRFVNNIWLFLGYRF